MRLVCVDTSALVALLFDEPAAKSVRSALTAANAIYAANLVEAELLSVARREESEPEALAPLLGCVEWVFPVRSLRPECELVLEHGHVPGAEVWHLACALYVSDSIAPPVFVSCDEGQREAAAALGLEVLP